VPANTTETKKKSEESLYFRVLDGVGSGAVFPLFSNDVFKIDFYRQLKEQ
jgi:hypothetical protein